MVKISPKVQGALVAGLLFFIVSNPMTYQLVDSVLGGLVGRIASASGCPTNVGLIVHSAVFATLVFYGVARV
jgi:hypothetical protein